MIPYTFDYTQAQSIQEAVSLLASNDEAKLLAGGHSLIPTMKLRLDGPAMLIDVSGIAELSQIREMGGELHLGAMVTHRAVEYSDIIRASWPILSDAAALIGDPQVRNRGTIGGSLAHADPAADYPALILALNARIAVTGPTGSRTINADDYFQGLFDTALAEGEMITEIIVPALESGTGAAYAKFPHPASKFAVVGVAARVELDSSGVCMSARVGVTGASDHAHRAMHVENNLVGNTLNEQTIAAATAKVADASDLLNDTGASAEYRAHLCTVMAKQAISAAAERARG